MHVCVSSISLLLIASNTHGFHQNRDWYHNYAGIGTKQPLLYGKKAHSFFLTIEPLQYSCQNINFASIYIPISLHFSCDSNFQLQHDAYNYCLCYTLFFRHPMCILFVPKRPQGHIIQAVVDVRAGCTHQHVAICCLVKDTYALETNVIHDPGSWQIAPINKPNC